MGEDVIGYMVMVRSADSLTEIPIRILEDLWNHLHLLRNFFSAYFSDTNKESTET